MARVFDELRIDYCCGGDKPLEQACRERRIDVATVLESLGEAIAEETCSATDWAEAPLTELCDHIERTHHRFLRTELPRLTNMIAKVVEAHGKNHPELADVEHVFAELRAELEPHMLKEERILFPAVRHTERTRTRTQFPFGTLGNPIRAMEHEHDAAGDALAKLHQLTDGYRIPNDACATYRTMLDSLDKLERDLHQHIHLENNILFPRAEELEKSVS
jgi:regulator of cell morphogenesis and NO signaling